MATKTIQLCDECRAEITNVKRLSINLRLLDCQTVKAFTSLDFCSMECFRVWSDIRSFSVIEEEYFDG
jgi:hypothetical protein